MEANGGHIVPLLERQGERLGTMERVLQEGFRQVTAAIEKLEVSLLAAATGKEHVPVPIVKWMHGAYLAVIAGLLFTLIFVLTGQQFNIIPKP